MLERSHIFGLYFLSLKIPFFDFENWAITTEALDNWKERTGIGRDFRFSREATDKLSIHSNHFTS